MSDWCAAEREQFVIMAEALDGGCAALFQSHGLEPGAPVLHPAITELLDEDQVTFLKAAIWQVLFEEGVRTIHAAESQLSSEVSDFLKSGGDSA